MKTCCHGGVIGVRRQASDVGHESLVSRSRPLKALSTRSSSPSHRKRGYAQSDGAMSGEFVFPQKESSSECDSLQAPVRMMRCAFTRSRSIVGLRPREERAFSLQTRVKSRLCPSMHSPDSREAFCHGKETLCALMPSRSTLCMGG